MTQDDERLAEWKLWDKWFKSIDEDDTWYRLFYSDDSISPKQARAGAAQRSREFCRVCKEKMSPNNYKTDYHHFQKCNHEAMALFVMGRVL